MTLGLYFTKRFASMVLRVLLIFFGIMMLIDVIDQLRRFSDTDIGLSGAAHLALMNVPESLYRILPLIFVMAALAMFLGLAKSSELVVVRAAGQSGLRFLLAPVGTALALGAFAVGVLNPMVAATTKEYDRLWAKHSANGASLLSVADTGLWLRQGGTEGQTVIQAARSNADGTELFGVTFLTYAADGAPVQRTEARTAVLEAGAWVLTEAKTWDLTGQNPEAVATVAMEGLRLASDLTPDAIRDSFGTPSAIPIWDLPGYIAGLENAGFSARSHRVWFQMELALPLLLAAMVLVAAGFSMRHARFGKPGKLVLLAMLAGFGIFFLRNFAQVLGENGQIPIALAAWSPPVAAIMMSLGLLLHLEDG
ncbi:MAG: LPS export ABC transporter permease LptG [Paracoccaceae bacterium]